MFAAALDESAQEYHFVACFLDRHIIVSDAFIESCHLVQLMIVCGKQCAGMCTAVLMQVFHYCPRDGNPVVGGRSPAQFVKEHQTPLRDIIEDIGRFIHLNHECRFTQRDVVTGPDTREYLVHESYPCTLCRHKRTDLRQQYYQCRLTQQCRLARHIRPGDDHYLLTVGIKVYIIGYITFPEGQLPLDDGVTSALDVYCLALVYLGTYISVFCGN